jgi:hypothetical protein
MPKFTALYNDVFDACKEAKVWYDETRGVVVKSFNTFE